MTDAPPTAEPLLPSTDGIDIPGLAFRHLRDDGDHEPLAALMTASTTADGIEYVTTADSLRNELLHQEDFDPRTDLLLAESQGSLVGFGQPMRMVRDGIAVYYCFGTVHPDVRRRGLGRRILHGTEDINRRHAARFDDSGGRALAGWVDDRQPGAKELFESEGYAPIRYGTTMRIQGLDGVEEQPLPDGLEIRPVTPDQNRAIFDADAEAFLDHWGSHERTDEEFAALYGEPELDTSLWRVAWDGDQIAGVVMTSIWRTENQTLGLRRGWLERISTRRPWRRRGLAKALIASALIGLRDAGMDEAMLGVDTENVTGALGLYESLGFVAEHRATQYRKVF